MFGTFVVVGEPFGKQRPKFSTVNGLVKTYTPVKTRNYEEAVREAFLNAGIEKADDNEMIYVEINAYYRIPTSVTKRKRNEMLLHLVRPITKPDLDNIAKSILDALNGYAYKDDSRVVECGLHKWYSDNPRVEVKLWTDGSN